MKQVLLSLSQSTPTMATVHAEAASNTTKPSVTFEQAERDDTVICTLQPTQFVCMIAVSQSATSNSQSQTSCNRCSLYFHTAISIRPRN